MALHCKQCGHTAAQFRFVVIDHIPMSKKSGNSELSIKQKEVRWIARLDTLISRELKMDFNLHVLL